MKPLVLRLGPGLALLLTAAVVLRLAPLRDATLPLLPGLTWMVFGAGFLFGWRFRRGRLVLALTLLFLTDLGLHGLVGGGTRITERAAVAAMVIFVPADIAALVCLPERGLFSPRGRWNLALIGAQAIVVVLLSRPLLAPITAAVLDLPLVDVPLGVIPQVGLFAFLVALMVVAVRVAQTNGAPEIGLGWALVAAFLALARGRAGGDPSLFLVAGSLALVISVIETSHGMAYGDELTGLPGRRALNEALPELTGRYTVAMVDIDHFKKFNDSHGHDVGDQLLRMVGSRLGKVGGGGQAFRYGGEEFAVLFPGRPLEDALPHLEDLRRGIETSGFILRAPDRRRDTSPPATPSTGARRVAVTVSIGAAEAKDRHTPAEAIVQDADEALYRAKRAGRNRVAT